MAISLLFRRAVESVVRRSEAWVAPALLNSWVNFGGAYSPVGYYKDNLNIVHLRGLIKSGTATAGTPLFTLPAGYLPAYIMIFPTPSNDLYGETQVRATGSVEIVVGSNVWISLDGISFRAEA